MADDGFCVCVCDPPMELDTPPCHWRRIGHVAKIDGSIGCQPAFDEPPKQAGMFQPRGGRCAGGRGGSGEGGPTATLVLGGTGTFQSPRPGSVVCWRCLSCARARACTPVSVCMPRPGGINRLDEKLRARASLSPLPKMLAVFFFFPLFFYLFPASSLQ